MFTVKERTMYAVKERTMNAVKVSVTVDETTVLAVKVRIQCLQSRKRFSVYS